jgi:integrase
MVALKDKPRLTPSAIAALEPRADAYELADAGCAGLRLRVEPTGRKTFRWYTRDGKKRVVVTVGAWSERAEPDHVTLAEARQRLAELKAARDEGRLASERHSAGSPSGTLTVSDLVDEYVAHLKRRRKTADQVERALKRDVVPAIGNMPLAIIKPRDVRRVVEEVVKRGSPSSADHLFVHLSGLLRFAVGRGEIGMNPAATLDRDAIGCETNRRARVLADEEIPAFWNALDRSGLTSSVRAGLRLLLLLGVRSGELLRAGWDEFDLSARVWTVPIEHQKLGRKQRAHAKPWRVPLSDQALAQLERLRVLSEGSAYVMASPSPIPEEDSPLTEKSLVAGMRKLFSGKAPLLTFVEPRPTCHDLRRTLRTGLARLKVPRDVAERCLNHALPEIEERYNQHDYLDERREALERWGAHVAVLVASTSNVVALNAAR